MALGAIEVLGRIHMYEKAQKWLIIPDECTITLCVTVCSLRFVCSFGVRNVSGAAQSSQERSLKRNPHDQNDVALLCSNSRCTSAV